MRIAAMEAIHNLARRDKRVLFIGSDLGAGVLDAMRLEIPERFFMEGIAEAAIIGMAAGLALEGYIPFVSTIATFITRRAYEQVAIDVCLQRLPVRLIASGGGAVYAPLGPTHMATDDFALLRSLPNMTIVAPADAPEMRRAIDATLSVDGPVYIRIAKGGEAIISDGSARFSIGSAVEMRAGQDLLFVATGIMTSATLIAAETIADHRIDVGVLHMHTVKPLDAAALCAAAARARLVISVEEHSRIGGLGTAVAEALSDAGIVTPLLRLGLPDKFLRDYGSQEYVLSMAGLSPESISETALRKFRTLLSPTERR